MLSAASPILRSRPSWLKAAQRPLSSGVPTENSDKLAGEDEGRKRVPKPTPHAAATILQSACLRTTATPRPQPTLFHLAGLEAKPLWSAQNARASGGFDDGSAPPEDSTAATNENTPANLAFPWLSELGRPENIDAMTSEYEALVADGVPSDYSTKDSSREGGEHKMHKGNCVPLSTAATMLSFSVNEAAQDVFDIRVSAHLYHTDMLITNPFQVTGHGIRTSAKASLSRSSKSGARRLLGFSKRSLLPILRSCAWFAVRFIL